MLYSLFRHSQEYDAKYFVVTYMAKSMILLIVVTLIDTDTTAVGQPIGDAT